MLKELEQRHVQIPGAFGNVEKRIAFAVQSAVERRGTAERLACVRVRERERHQHTELTDYVAVYDGVVDIADDSELRICGRHEYRADNGDARAPESQLDLVPAGLQS